MHCEEPGCLAACPADGAIVQYANGIVDFQQANCIGCGYCITGCPFNIPKFSPTARKVFKCTLCNDRVTQGLEPACIKSCPTGCLHFGTKTEMKELAEKRAAQLRDTFWLRQCGRLRSRGRRRHARHLRPARRHESRSLWRPAEGSAHSVDRAALEEAAEMARQCRDGRRLGRHRRSLLALRAEEGRRDETRIMGGGHDDGAVSTRRQPQRARSSPVLVCRAHDHWIGALSYIYLLLTGLAFWSPGSSGNRGRGRRDDGASSASMVRLDIRRRLFWMFGVAGDMQIDDSDRTWARAMPHYIRNEDDLVPQAGRFNAGQKLFFWGFF